MKRVELIRKLDEAGCVFIRRGGNHDWYRNPKTGFSQPVPGLSGKPPPQELPYSGASGRAIERHMWATGLLS